MDIYIGIIATSIMIGISLTIYNGNKNKNHENKIIDSGLPQDLVWYSLGLCKMSQNKPYQCNASILL